MGGFGDFLSGISPALSFIPGAGPWLAAGAGILGSAFGNDKDFRGTPSTSEPVLMDTVDPRLKQQLIDSYLQFLSGPGAGGGAVPGYGGPMGTDMTPAEQRALSLLGGGLNLNTGNYTPEERAIMARLTAINGDRATSDVLGLEGRVRDQAMLGFNEAGGAIRKAANIGGSAQGGWANTSLSRAAGDMGTNIAGNLAPLLAAELEAGRGREMAALSARAQIAQNPWVRGLQSAQLRLQQGGALGEMGLAQRGFDQNAIQNQIAEFNRKRELENYLKYQLPMESMNLGGGLAQSLAQQIAMKSVGGTPPSPFTGMEGMYEFGRLAAEGAGGDGTTMPGTRPNYAGNMNYPYNTDYGFTNNNAMSDEELLALLRRKF